MGWTTCAECGNKYDDNWLSGCGICNGAITGSIKAHCDECGADGPAGHTEALVHREGCCYRIDHSQEGVRHDDGKLSPVQCTRCGLGYPDDKKKCPACKCPNYSHFSGVTDAMLGIRHDDGKPRMDLLPGDALFGVARVMTWACTEKDPPYDPRNWEKGMPWSKLFAPILRHLWDWWQGKEVDDESGLHPLEHAACDCLMLLASVMREIGEDDRPGKGKE